MPKKKTLVSIKTFGCQMNMYDTEVAEGLLAQGGFELIPDSEEDVWPGKNGKTRNPVDIYLMNTCSVREHAEHRVYGRLGFLGKAKEENPNLIVGLMGCMVEEHRQKLFRRFPSLDFMVGTRNIKELPSLIHEVRKTRKQVSKIKQDGISIEYTDQIQRKGNFHAWLPIMTGCNKVCTFCIVPTTRGSEVSMPAREVYREASRLVEDGVKWITLLGQNVNSYNGAQTQDPRPKTQDQKRKNQGALNLESWDLGPESRISFPVLLDMLCEIEGLERISFTTSHPHDATPELYEVIAKNPKISRRFHLPLQSGSDRILKRMKRLHTYSEYKAKIDLMRQVIPNVSVTTDIIAGFSGETEGDHHATLRALDEIQYDGAYIYKYSVRPETPAAKLADDVSHEDKVRRNNELLARQKKIEVVKRDAQMNQVVEVFVENQNSHCPTQLRGRSHQEKIVAFEGDPGLIGTFQKIQIEGLNKETFVGKLVQPVGIS